MVGSMPILNAGTFSLRGELSGRGMVVLESTGDPEALTDGRVDLAPTSRGRPRVLVSVRPRPGADDAVAPDPVPHGGPGVGLASGQDHSAPERGDRSDLRPPRQRPG